MSDEPTQRTRAGIEIPIPTKKAVMDALFKIARPVPKEDNEPEPESV